MPDSPTVLPWTPRRIGVELSIQLKAPHRLKIRVVNNDARELNAFEFASSSSMGSGNPLPPAASSASASPTRTSFGLRWTPPNASSAGRPHTAPELVTQELLDELRRVSPFDPDHLPREIELIETFRQRHEAAAGGLFSHRCSLYDATCCQAASSPALLQRERNTTLWFPRFVLCLPDGRTGALWRLGGKDRPRHPRSPGQRRQHGRRTRWQKHRHQHELHAAGGIGDEHAFGRFGSQPGTVSGAYRGRRKPSRCSVIRRKSESAGSPLRSVAWTRSCSLEASGKMRPASARICDGLGFLGIELSDSRNAETAGVISTDESRATVRVIRTDEDLMIARSVYRILETNAVNNKGRI
jgi:hypothetical protein